MKILHWHDAAANPRTRAQYYITHTYARAHTTHTQAHTLAHQNAGVGQGPCFRMYLFILSDGHVRTAHNRHTTHEYRNAVRTKTTSGAATTCPGMPRYKTERARAIVPVPVPVPQVGRGDQERERFTRTQRDAPCKNAAAEVPATERNRVTGENAFRSETSHDPATSLNRFGPRFLAAADESTPRRPCRSAAREARTRTARIAHALAAAVDTGVEGREDSALFVSQQIPARPVVFIYRYTLLSPVVGHLDLRAQSDISLTPRYLVSVR